MKFLYYDCFAGISGDMNLGAMIDLGVDPAFLVESLRALDISGYELAVSRQSRRGITGTKVDVVLSAHDGRGHNHHERKLDDIRKILTAASLSDGVRRRSLRMFEAIARAESKVHGIDINAVHFHEVGAVDAIVDIVGAALCFEYLGVDRAAASSVELGGGFVHCAHGTLPVPAPATTEILRGVPVRTGGAPREMTTPTGAAILVSLVDTFSDSVSFQLKEVGYGIGTDDTEIPNVLRVMLGEKSGDSSGSGHESGEVWLVECNIDDMNPELYEHVLDRLLEKGARDAFMTPIIMKKSRPAVVLSVLCDTDRLAGVEEIVLTETTTLGLRKQRLSRTTLRRGALSVMTDYGEVRIKRTFRGNALVTWKPEYEDCRNIAREKGVSIQDVYGAVERAFPQLNDVTEQSK